MADISDSVFRYIASYLDENIYTSIPAVVTDVIDFEGSMLIDVQPLINKLYEDNHALQPPILQSVPVVFPSGGGGMLSFPIEIGDTVMVLFAKYSIENWLEGDGSQNTPDLMRNFSTSDGVAIPCIYPTSQSLQPNPKDVELKFNGSSFRFKSDENGKGVELTTDADITINGVNISNTASDSITLTAPEVIADGDTTVTGKFGTNGAAAQTSAVLAPVANNLATVIALANSMRVALVNNGIGS